MQEFFSIGQLVGSSKNDKSHANHSMHANSWKMLTILSTIFWRLTKWCGD